MSTLTLDQLRSKYLDFFVKQGHSLIPSASLVPENDPSTLFTSAGMQPLIPYLLGQPHPKGSRLVNSQKSFRSQDIEEVGDNRHTTFFEMLGNWSLGDYFKHEQIEWVFTFLVKEIGLDPQKIYVTVYGGNEQIGVSKDLEAVERWQEMFDSVGITATAVESAEENGMQGGRIFFYGDKKNWWSRSGIPANMPVGEPGGPDSEVFFDFGAELQLHEHSEFKDLPCHVNCDCGRFMEIGNSVFMQFSKNDQGEFVELPNKNIDFGGGLERILAAVNGDRDVFKTVAFQPIIVQLEKVSGQQYGTDEKVNRSFRVISDHLKSAIMLAADGVRPANKEQGYIARRLIRRAVRYGKLIGITKPFLGEMVGIVAQMYQQPYPEVAAQAVSIQQTISEEELKFSKTLEKGLKEIEKLPQLDGGIAFRLYETYGFPLELTEEIAQERGQVIDKEIFEKAFDHHKEQSRSASAGKFKGGLADHSQEVVRFHTATHLLHAALRKFLGTEVQQKGSNITSERLRFDFSFPRAVTQAEQERVEAQINDWIQADLSVTKETLSKTEALESGAIAFFVEKYPDEVTVYTIGPTNDWISKEFCGGPHVGQTGEIGPIKLVKEQAVAAGIRRIYIQSA